MFTFLYVVNCVSSPQPSSSLTSSSSSVLKVVYENNVVVFPREREKDILVDRKSNYLILNFTTLKVHYVDRSNRE